MMTSGKKTNTRSATPARTAAVCSVEDSQKKPGSSIANVRMRMMAAALSQPTSSSPPVAWFANRSPASSV